MADANQLGGVAGRPQAREMSEQQKLRLQRAVRDFEAIIVGYMMKSMRSSSEDVGMLGEGLGGDMLGSMFDAELSRQMSRSSQLGIAEMLYRQVTGESLPRPARGVVAATPETLPAAAAARPAGLPAANPARQPALLIETPVVTPAVTPGATPVVTSAATPTATPTSLAIPAPAPDATPAVGKKIPPPVRVRIGQTVAERVNTYAPLIREAAGEHGVEENLLKAIIASESGGNPRARSHRNAKGLMQLIDSTAREVGVANAWNPRDNIMGGARYIAQLLDRFDGDLERAVASYNAGPGAVEKHGGIPPFRETKAYVARVFEYLNYFQQSGTLGDGNDE